MVFCCKTITVVTVNLTVYQFIMEFKLVCKKKRETQQMCKRKKCASHKNAENKSVNHHFCHLSPR